MIEALIALGVFALIVAGLACVDYWTNAQASADAKDQLDWWKDTHA